MKYSVRISCFILFFVLTFFQFGEAKCQNTGNLETDGKDSVLMNPKDKIVNKTDVILTPVISAMIPVFGEVGYETGITGGKVFAYDISMKYGGSVSFRIRDFIYDFSFAYSPYNITAGFIKNMSPNIIKAGNDYEGAAVFNLTSYKASCDAYQFTTGFRYCLTESRSLFDYLSLGLGFYSRSDINGEYTGTSNLGNRTEYHTTTFKTNTAESALSMYGGFGATIMLIKNLGIDLKFNGHLLFLSEGTAFWIEPLGGICFLF